MSVVNRLCVTNRVQTPATVLSASSSQTGQPVSWLKDQLRSKTWRSAIGWTIVTGVNDAIPYNRSGAKVAKIAAGTYATGTLLAAAIVAALEAIDATPVWASSYSGSTFKFTINSDIAFALLWSSGADTLTACHKDLGFAVADTGSATSQTGATAVYQSRHWIKADLVTAAAVLGGIVVNHNSGTGGTYTLQGNATDAWTAPTVSQVLSGDAAIRIAYISTQTLRYWRLVIDDSGNTLGYGEVGIWFAGPYTETVRGYAEGWGKAPRSLNVVSAATSGAHFVDVKAERPIWTPLEWRAQTAAQRDALMSAFALVSPGLCFFFAFDAVDAPTSTEYVFLEESASFTHRAGLIYTVTAPTLVGALG